MGSSSHSFILRAGKGRGQHHDEDGPGACPGEGEGHPGASG